MKIMTFNIFNGGVDEYGSRIDKIKKVIKEADPDFVALQEVNKFDEDNYKLLREVSQYIGLPYYALSRGVIQETGIRHNVASLSRFPLKEKHTFSGPTFPGGAALYTAIRVADSSIKDLVICNVHLTLLNKPKKLESQRLKELKILLKHGAMHENLIFLGDFNSLSADDNYDPKTAEVEFSFDVTNKLKQGFVDVATHVKLNNRSTYPTPVNINPAITKPLRIDYIFVSSSLRDYIKDAAVVKTQDSEQASDHYPFIVTLE